MSSVMSHGQLQVPPGLPSALESLARAVLKEQPDDLPKFAAAHFQALLRQREASGNDPFTSSAAINEETLPPKFEKPLPESQRVQSPEEQDMGSGASKSKSPVQPSAPSPTPAESVTESQATNTTEGPDTATQASDEVADIDLNDPATEDAAVKIQAAFRGHQVRKDMNIEDASPGDENKDQQIGDAVPSQHDKLEEDKPKEEEIDIDLSDPATEEAALKIQSAFRGHQTRQELKGSKDEDEVPSEETNAGESEKAEADQQSAEEEKPKENQEEEIDIDLNDPATEEAATKIQAAFRGHQVRAEMGQRFVKKFLIKFYDQL
ncbi:unnamed protein product [Oikopleura dioica]|uniref:RIIa domain-containing protein n=1 Tax=Oikopleura dioica TaxID=34765 RepID=E4YTU5_OIKDI|nr:unnamed protein product [Oikopleura dioica]